jgi:uncharacterized Ntn-hydrolase superfamily protein
MTYSIVARDPRTRELGIAVQSRYFAAGRVVPWIEAGLGVIASQAFANPMYGDQGLKLLRAGEHPRDILDRLVAQDAGGSRRQVAILDIDGRMAAHTGALCVAAAGHAMGTNCCAQGNMLARDTVWPAMAEAFESCSGTLAERLLAALEAAEREGGDLRGRQAAALIVAKGASSGVAKLDLAVDLRVDDHLEPVKEIRRLLAFARANEHANRAMEKLLANDVSSALSDLEDCCEAYADEPVFQFRRALALLQLGRPDEARQALRRARTVHPGWDELLLRFADAGVIPMSRAALAPLVQATPGDAVPDPRPSRA